VAPDNLPPSGLLLLTALQGDDAFEFY